MPKILTKNFFDRSAPIVAQELLGKFLVREKGGKKIALAITETEAYDGPKDRASHASRGKTERNKVMFGPAGVWYVYFIYGMHHMLNIVTDGDKYPSAVLIRGVEGVNGPARVSKLFGVTKNFYGQPADKKSGLYIEDRGVKIDPKKIKKLPRVGVAYAGPTWAGKKYRFVLCEQIHDKFIFPCHNSAHE